MGGWCELYPVLFGILDFSKLYKAPKASYLPCITRFAVDVASSVNEKLRDSSKVILSLALTPTCLVNGHTLILQSVVNRRMLNVAKPGSSVHNICSGIFSGTTSQRYQICPPPPPSTKRLCMCSIIRVAAVHSGMFRILLLVCLISQG